MQADPCGTATCPGYFGHVYRATGTRTVTATASYVARYRIGGGAQLTIPGTVQGPTATDAVTVQQARAVLVPNPDD